MRAGTLRHRLVVQQNNPTKNEFGESVENWTDFATVWAAIEPLTGSERWLQNISADLAQATTRIRIRYRDDINTAMQGLHRGNTYDFEYVANRWTRDQEIWIVAIERDGVLPSGGDNGAC